MTYLPAKIEGMIPHKPPMLLVHELLSCTEQEALVRSKPGAESMFSNGSHLDRIVGIEMVAQSYAALRAWLAAKQGKSLTTGYLVGVQRARLKDLPLAKHLNIKVCTVGEFEEFAIAEGEVYCDELLLSEVRLKLWSQIQRS